MVGKIRPRGLPFSSSSSLLIYRMQGRKGKIKAIDPFSKTGGVVDIYKGKVIDLPPKPSDIEAVSPKIRNLFRPLQPSKKKLEKQEQAQKRKFAVRNGFV